MIEALGCHLVKLAPEEADLSSTLLSGLASILDLDAWEPELELMAEAEMQLKCVPIKGPSGEEEELTCAPVILDPLLTILVKVALVAVELLLRVNELEKLGLLPPAASR